MAAPDSQAISTNGTEPVSEPLAARPVPTPAPTPAPAPPTQPAPEQQQGPFTVDQVRAWAEGKPPTAEQQGPFTVDQVKQWAERGTGPTETSQVLGERPWWSVALGALPGDTNIGRLVQQKGLQAVTDAVAGGFGLGAGAAELARAVEQPTTLFEGQSVAQVQAERDRLQGELAQLDKDVDQRSASGQLTGDDILGSTLYEKGLRQRLDAANQYIQSGGKATEDWVSTGLKSLSGLFTAGQRGVTQFGQREIPKITGEVPAEVERSPLGTAATIGAQIAAAVPLMATDPLVATTVFGTQGFQNFYQDAKDHGADDRAAAVSGLMGASLAPLQATMVEAPGNVVNTLLAKMLAGSTWKQGLAELATGGLKGAAIQGGAQYLSNVTAHVAGYDPNRPLDAGVWQQALAGGAIDTITTSIAMAGRRRAAQPPPAGVPGEVEVKTKPPAPAQAPAAAAVTAAAPQTEAEIHAELQRNLDQTIPETAPAPTTAPVPGEAADQLAARAAIGAPRPSEEAAPSVPAPAPTAQPLAEAAEAVRESQARAPETVLAAQGTPEQRLETGRQELQQTLGAVEQPAPLAEAAAPPAAEAPAPATGRIVETRAGPMPEEWVSPTAVRETGAPPEDPEIIRRIISAYQEVSAERDRISVPISDVIERAGVPLEEGRAAIAAHPNVQLDEGDWSLAPLAQRQAAIRELGRERLYMAFPEATAAAAARPEPLAPGPMARMVGPAGAGRVTPPEILPQAQAKQIVNRSAEQAGLEGRILYAANENSLPLRLKDQLVTRGLRGRGQTQTIWDNRQGQLWVIGDAFRNAAELHRALIEEAIPRAFDHGQMPIATVHTPEDPRLGWWDPVKQQATLNTAQLVNRPEPLLDASKTAVHESVVHAGLERMFANTPEGRAAYEQTLGALRQRFDSTNMSQELAISRGFADVGEMTRTYAELYGKSGQELANAVTEELLATYAEEHFPTRASLEQSPRWYQEALGRLGSALRREFDWQLSDWDVQQLVRDSYAASRPGKTPLGVGSVPVRPEAIRPEGQVVAVMDNHAVTDPRLANVGQLEVGHPLNEPQMERLYGMLEGSGHPVGVIERPEGPIFINYDERRLANEDFHALVGDAVRAILGEGHQINFARNEGTYASNDPITIRTSQTKRPAALRTGRQPGLEAGLRPGGELLSSAPGFRGPPGEAPGTPDRFSRGPGETEWAARERAAAAATAAGEPGGPTPRQEPAADAAAIARSGGRAGGGWTAASEPRRATYERASVRGGGGEPPEEPRPDPIRGAESEADIQRRLAEERARTEAGLQPGEGIRAGAGQQQLGRVPRATVAERLAAQRREGGAVYGKRPFELVSPEARDHFNALGQDPYKALDELALKPDFARSDTGVKLGILASDELRGMEQALRDAGETEAADRVQADIQRANREIMSRSTETAQALSAERLRYQNGDSILSRTQKAMSDIQDKRLRREFAVGAAREQIARMRNELVNRALGGLNPILENLQRRIDKITGVARGESLADRYIRYRSEQIDSWGARQGAAPTERAALDEAFGRFAKTVREKIQEQVSLPKAAPKETMSVEQRVRESLSNWAMLDRLWKASVERLKGDNPNSLFFSKLSDEIGAPVSQEQVRGLIRELGGADVRQLAQQSLTVQDRIKSSIADGLVRDAGLSEDQAIQIQQHITDAVNKVVRDEQRRQLETIQKNVGGKTTPARRASELDRLMQMLNIGAFDKAEYYNAIRERFGLPGWNDGMARNIRSAGDQLQKIQADQGPHELMEEYKAKIADLLEQSQPMLTKAERTAQSLWLASLLTGPATHIPYWGWNSLKALMDLSFRNLEGLRTGKMTPGDVLQTYNDVARQVLHRENWSEFGMQLATGYRQHRPGEAAAPGQDVFGLRSLGALPQRAGLESTPLPGGRLNYLNLYKYVPRFLEAVNGLFYRGASEGLMRNIALREAQDRGMDPDQARRWAAEVMFGTEQQRADAQARAAEDGEKYNLTPAQQARRVEELIREARPQELSEEANRFALHAFYRESPIGGLGVLARVVQQIKQEHPSVTFLVPFVNIAGNALNEAVNWTPLGFWRGQHLESLYKGVPGMRPLFEGELTPSKARQLNDLQAEYNWKATVGASLVGGLATYLNSQLSNPNPWFNVHGPGPQNPDQRKAWALTGARPFTVKLGDRYFRYADSPFSMVLGALGGMADAWRYDFPRKGTAGFDYVTDSALAALGGGARVLTDHSFLLAVSTLFNTLSAHGPDQERQASDWLASMAAGVMKIPIGGTAAGQLYKMWDPQTYENKSAQGKLFSQVPFANSALLEPRLNLFGENMDSNSIYRIIGSPGRPEPVYQFLAQHNIGLSEPQLGRVYYPGTNTALPPNQYEAYVRARGQSFKEMLQEHIADPDFGALPPDVLNKEVQAMERAATEEAKGVIADTYPAPAE